MIVLLEDFSHGVGFCFYTGQEFLRGKEYVVDHGAFRNSLSFELFSNLLLST
jgi:hypothetical protein